MSFFLGLTVLSLMAPLRLETGFVLLRPFEILTVLMFLYGAFFIWRKQGIKISKGLLLLLPYLFWHVFSAFEGGAANMLRELLQVSAVMIFAYTLAQEISKLDLRLILRMLFMGMVIIILGTIIWHLMNGYIVGWKRINDTRTAFVFFPALLSVLILFAKQSGRMKLWWIWIAIAPLLLISGERKALVIYLMLTSILLAKGRWALIAPIASVSLVALFLLSTVIDNSYLQSQIRTLVDPASTGNYEYVLSTGQYLPGDSVSNVQRAFAFSISRELFQESPFVGVGTNQYTDVLNQMFPELPQLMRNSIHGEFQRILTENGLIGLLFYLLIWVVSWLRFSNILKKAVSVRFVSIEQARLLPLLLFIPFALYLGTEAPGTRSFIMLIIISFLPEFATGILRKRWLSFRESDSDNLSSYSPKYIRAVPL